MEDATSALYSAFLMAEEGTASSFQGLREVVDKHGLFCSLYRGGGQRRGWDKGACRPAFGYDPGQVITSCDTMAVVYR